jgi:hypothetical protein
VKRLLACMLAAAALGAAGWSATGPAATWRADTVLTAKPGDRIRVVGAPIACRVVRMSQLGGRVVVDCRRAGALQGTYGTFLTAREAVLVRFESERTAKRVAVGVHERSSERCR